MCHDKSIRGFFSLITETFEVAVEYLRDDWDLIFQEVPRKFHVDQKYGDTVECKNHQFHL